MADDRLSVLTRFHREVMLPDVERTVQDSERRVRDEVLSHFDATYKRFDRLESEYQALSAAAVSRLEVQLGSTDSAGAAISIRDQIRQLKDKVAELQKRIEELESVC